MLGKIWGLVLLVLGIYIAYEVVQLKDEPTKKPSVKRMAKDEKPPEPSPGDLAAAAAEANVPLQYAPKSEEEISASVEQVCQEMVGELEAENIAPAFGKISIKYREKRLQTDLLKALISSCFDKKENAPASLEIEVFSSEFEGEGEARNQIQLQVSVFDQATSNKIFEVGRRFETVKISLARPAATPEN
ncbi:MAG: hypothetical protein KF767_13585 [Bdellovibrionaceae bacterium]|nr:hypothetical protein [Pseudobdellovibrionaceae bacterium]